MIWLLVRQWQGLICNAVGLAFIIYFLTTSNWSWWLDLLAGIGSGAVFSLIFGYMVGRGSARYFGE